MKDEANDLFKKWSQFLVRNILGLCHIMINISTESHQLSCYIRMMDLLYPTLMYLACFDSLLFNFYFESPLTRVRSLPVSTDGCCMNGCHPKGGRADMVRGPVEASHK